MTTTFAKMLDLCEKQGFLRKIVYPKINQDFLRIGSMGALLQENLRQEWLNHILLNKDMPVFMSTSDKSTSSNVSKDIFLETFNFAKSMCLDRAPFGMAEIVEKKSDGILKRVGEKKEPHKVLDFGRYTTCTDAKSGNAKSDRGGTKSVEIVAKYPWGDQLLESLKVSNPRGVSPAQLQVKKGKRTVELQCIVSESPLSTMLLNALCDAYDEPLVKDAPRPMLKLHPNLAPYKFSLSISVGLKSVADELKDLGSYLCRQLRNNRISCLYLPSSYRHTLEAQWEQYDQLGVLYNIILNENTLRKSCLLIRNRDTNIKDLVQVDNLVQYAAHHCRT